MNTTVFIHTIICRYNHSLAAAKWVRHTVRMLWFATCLRSWSKETSTVYTWAMTLKYCNIRYYLDNVLEKLTKLETKKTKQMCLLV